jgi:predicted HNH restriction endonuclease
LKALHIVQGGIENGDKAWIEKAARSKSGCTSWVVPKGVNIGDDVVIFIRSFGFFATAQITSLAKQRKDWANRYGAGLKSIRLIKPAISLFTIRHKIPKLTWAIYPRSITTPSAKVAKQIRSLIEDRRKIGLPELSDKALDAANIDELRKVAFSSISKASKSKKRNITFRIRSNTIRRYVLCRAEGYCEACEKQAPFLKSDGSPYLEPHHTTRLADEGLDHPLRVIALCPNCHRHAHYSKDAKYFNDLLKKIAVDIESERVE